MKPMQVRVQQLTIILALLASNLALIALVLEPLPLDLALPAADADLALLKSSDPLLMAVTLPSMPYARVLVRYSFL